MIGTSDAFNTGVRTSHQAACQVDVTDPDGVVVATLPVHGGAVDADRTAAQWRRFTADVADPDGSLTPQTMRDKLTPFGTQVRVYRGVFIPNVQTVAQDYQTAAAWNTGTRVNTVTTPGGALQLG